MSDIIINDCPLCKERGELFYQHGERDYFRCKNCYGLFLLPSQQPSKSAEKVRYEKHNNDVEDRGYQKFVSPITSHIVNDYGEHHHGLDFGAGKVSVIARVLMDYNFHIALYDPFFHPNHRVLETKYDYISCCEVIEHFHNPGKEFWLLNSLLAPGGKLYCMTDMYDEEMGLREWYYLTDFTHVFIYHEKTLQWIQRKFGFSSLTIKGRLIIYNK